VAQQGAKKRTPARATLIVACLVCLLGGCNRVLYRLRADKEVKYLVSQKSNDPRWNYDTFTIGMNPRARYWDPTDPDWPAMPYDDPAAHRYMHCIDGKKDWPCWHAGGDWYGLENPEWKDLLTQYNEVTKDGALKLTMNGSVCLAQVNSSDYRTQIETIYLSALDLSTTRFGFDVQFFGNSNTVFDHDTNPNGSETNTLRQDTNFFFNKTFSTGGELMAGIANSIVWQFAGNDTYTSTSLLNFTFLQPLLKGGGRVVALEQLRVVERVLLYNLRAFQRYRQGFYCSVTVGNSNVGPVQGPQRRGGFLGNTGLTGFTGTGAGGIGGVAAGTFGIQTGQAGGVGGQQAGLGLAGGGAGATGGFVGLVQTLFQVRTTEANLDSLLRTLGLLEANLDAGLIDIVQVDNFRQNIETQRANLLTSRVQYDTQVDQFKLQTLGLPPDIPVEIDDGMLRQFEFLDPKTIAVQHLIDDFVRAIGKLPRAPALSDLKSGVELLGKLRERLTDQFASGRDDLKKLDAATTRRKRGMTDKESARFEEDKAKLAESMNDVEERFKQSAADLQALQKELGSRSPEELADDTVSLATKLSGLAQELTLIKARARLETVAMDPVELTDDKALDIARANRLDWMNNRAQLVDTWRLISFQANSLRSGLDLSFSGGLGTIGDNPLAFNGNNGNLRVGVRFDGPFTRRVERNNYRSVMIQYQQTRRQLYLYQDSINFTLRSLLRTMKQLEINLEIQRRAVTIAIRRVDKTREDLNKPPAPVQPGAQVVPLGPTVAQDLILALNDLQQVQNNFISVVFNHYENRMLLYRELGILELDNCGMWIDKPINAADWLTDDECPTPPAIPVEWMQDADVTQEDLQAYDVEHAGDGYDAHFKSLAATMQRALHPAGKSPRRPGVPTAAGRPSRPQGEPSKNQPTPSLASATAPLVAAPEASKKAAGIELRMELPGKQLPDKQLPVDGPETAVRQAVAVEKDRDERPVEIPVLRR
jgi:hypothetical protein